MNQPQNPHSPQRSPIPVEVCPLPAGAVLVLAHLATIGTESKISGERFCADMFIFHV